LEHSDDGTPCVIEHFDPVKVVGV